MFYLKSEKYFYLLLALTIGIIFYTNPFLKYPYDMFSHLAFIDKQTTMTSAPKGRGIWHYVWAQIFHYFEINRTDIFLRAKIIHYTQSIITFIIIFYVSKIFIKNLFLSIESNTLNYLAYWSTFAWFTVLSTTSMNHHQVWILWYSINYQITLPLTLLITGLSISLIFEDLSNKLKLLKLLTIVFFIYVILRVHAMEFIYFALYMSVLVVTYLDKFILFTKKHIYTSLFGFTLFIYGLINFIDYIKSIPYRKAPIFNYLSFEKLPQLLNKIGSEGETIIHHYNRASSTMNEFIYVSLLAITLIFIVSIFRFYKNHVSNINMRLMVFIFITSFFILIPIFQYTAGLASLLSYPALAYRFYFSSLLFLVIPSFVFYFFGIYKIKNVLLLNITIIIIFLSVFIYSKYDTRYQQNYYKNIISIKNSFSTEKMGFNLSQKDIELIGEKLNYYETISSAKKPKYYYARDDISFVIKFIYQKSVLYHRRGNKNYTNSYLDHNNTKYYPILFETPNNFPSYRRFE